MKRTNEKNTVQFQRYYGHTRRYFQPTILISKSQRHYQNIYACFNDYHKAFDSLKHDKLIEILNTVGVDEGDFKIIIICIGIKHQNSSSVKFQKKSKMALKLMEKV